MRGWKQSPGCPGASSQLGKRGGKRGQQTDRRAWRLRLQVKAALLREETRHRAVSWLCNGRGRAFSTGARTGSSHPAWGKRTPCFRNPLVSSTGNGTVRRLAFPLENSRLELVSRRSLGQRGLWRPGHLFAIYRTLPGEFRVL